MAYRLGNVKAKRGVEEFFNFFITVVNSEHYLFSELGTNDQGIINAMRKVCLGLDLNSSSEKLLTRCPSIHTAACKAKERMSEEFKNKLICKSYKKPRGLLCKDIVNQYVDYQELGPSTAAIKHGVHPSDMNHLVNKLIACESEEYKKARKILEEKGFIIQTLKERAETTRKNISSSINTNKTSKQLKCSSTIDECVELKEPANIPVFEDAEPVLRLDPNYFCKSSDVSLLSQLRNIMNHPLIQDATIFDDEFRAAWTIVYKKIHELN